MKIIDLTHNLNHHDTVFPGDSEFSLVCHKTIENDGYTIVHLESDLHVGTHIDAPVHLSSKNEWIDDLSLERCCGEAVLLDVRGNSVITAKKEWREKIQPNQIVLLLTAWDQYYGQKKYYQDYPVIDDSFSDLLIEKNVKMLGLDSCSPDDAPYLQHKKLLSNGILLLENLTNLSSLLHFSRFQLMALPIHWHAEASFVRAVAMVK